MRRSLYAIIFVVLASCAKENTSHKDFTDKLLDLTTSTSNEGYSMEEYIQLTNLYDTLTNSLPEDDREKLILVEKLKQRGFEITRWGRGNLPALGPRIVDVELKKDDCICQVSKMYYFTTVDTLYQMAEGIVCKRTAK